MATTIAGIISGDERMNSLSEAQIVDLIAEGEIDGLVTKEYSFVGTLGNIGYSSASIRETKDPLSSVYWNNIPVIDDQGNYNFQDVNMKESFGTKKGSTDPLTRIDEPDDQLFEYLEEVRGINERLRGPTKGASEIPDDAQYFKKIYRILNTDCFALKVNLKITSLNTINKETGDLEDNTVNMAVETRALFNNSEENFNSANGQGVSSNVTAANALGGSFSGKLTSPFVKEYFIDFSKRADFDNIMDDPNFLGWEVKIYKTTPEPATTDSSSTTFVDSITNVYRTKLSYPNSAVICSSFSAEYFSSLPARAFDVRLLRIKIPSNYDPITRTYHGMWDGTFSTESVGPFSTGPGTPGIDTSGGVAREIGKYWTNNPAWCYYDLITNPRYGLGKYIEEQGLDKWSLYEVGQYCDTLVYDGLGKGGLEPRFTCNTLIQSREDAFKVVQDMTSVFRGLSYYAAGQIYAIQDAPKNPIYQFTNANVRDGVFSYSSTSRKIRNNIAIVRYNDKTNFYKPAIEYIEDVDGIRKNGIRETEVTAFGCTSRGQALRLGKWMLATENLETETVSFTAGLEGTYVRPGDVISISDSYRANLTRNGGRTFKIDQSNSNTSGTYAEITLDSIADVYREGDHNAGTSQMYQLTLLTPTYSFDPYNVKDLDSNDVTKIRNSQIQKVNFLGNQVTNVTENGLTRSKITFSGGHSFDLSDTNIVENQTVWSIEPTGGTVLKNSQGISIDADDMGEKFRVINIKEEKRNQYNISALEYDQEKYTKTEQDFEFNADGTNISTTIPSPPSSLTLSEQLAAGAQHTKLIKYVISPPADQTALAGYEVFMKKTTPWRIADYTGRYPNLWTTYDGNVAYMETNGLPSDENYVPDSKHKIAKHPRSNVSIEASVIAPTSDNYYLKAASFNGLGTHSSTTIKNSIQIDDSEAIKDVVISNLRLENDIIIENRSSQLQSEDGGLVNFTGANPNILWDTSIQGDAELATQFNYLVTLRQSSSNRQNSEPAGAIYHVETGFQPSLTQNDSFVYPITQQVLAQIQQTHGEAAARNFDVVIEAHTEEGLSSAGGSFKAAYTNGATKFSADFSNIDYSVAKGWDIADINDPSIDSPRFSSSANDCGDTDKICTSQSVTADNRLKIEFTKNTYQSNEKDIAGGYFYMCPTAFGKDEVAGKTQSFFDSTSENPKNIKRVRSDNYSDIMYVSFGGNLETSKVYACYSLFDFFDRDIENQFLDETPNNPTYVPTYDLGSTLPVSVVSEVKYLNPLATPERIPEYITIGRGSYSAKGTGENRRCISRCGWGLYQCAGTAGNGPNPNPVDTIVNLDFKKPIGKTRLVALEVDFSTGGGTRTERRIVRVSNMAVDYTPTGGVIQPFFLPEDLPLQASKPYGAANYNEYTSIIHDFSAKSPGPLKDVEFEEGETSIGTLHIYMKSWHEGNQSWQDCYWEKSYGGRGSRATIFISLGYAIRAVWT
jgi:hypothetical protein